MKRSKTSISKASSYAAIGEFWDSHDLGTFWKRTKPARFSVRLNSETVYVGVEKSLSNALARIAKRRGVSSQTLVNLWLQEKLQQVKAA